MKVQYLSALFTVALALGVPRPRRGHNFVLNARGAGGASIGSEHLPGSSGHGVKPQRSEHGLALLKEQSSLTSGEQSTGDTPTAGNTALARKGILKWPAGGYDSAKGIFAPPPGEASENEKTVFAEAWNTKEAYDKYAEQLNAGEYYLRKAKLGHVDVLKPHSKPWHHGILSLLGIESKSSTLNFETRIETFEKWSYTDPVPIELRQNKKEYLDASLIKAYKLDPNAGTKSMAGAENMYQPDAAENDYHSYKYHETNNANTLILDKHGQQVGIHHESGYVRPPQRKVRLSEKVTQRVYSDERQGNFLRLAKIVRKKGNSEDVYDKDKLINLNDEPAGKSKLDREQQEARKIRLAGMTDFQMEQQIDREKNAAATKERLARLKENEQKNVEEKKKKKKKKKKPWGFRTSVGDSLNS